MSTNNYLLALICALPCLGSAAWAQPIEKTLGDMSNSTMSMPPAMPAPMPSPSAITTQGSPLPPASSIPQAPQLVGIYTSGTSRVAEFMVEGKPRFASEDDEFKDGWVIKSISKSQVLLQRCTGPGSAKCKSKTMVMEID